MGHRELREEIWCVSSSTFYFSTIVETLILRFCYNKFPLNIQKTNTNYMLRMHNILIVNPRYFLLKKNDNCFDETAHMEIASNNIFLKRGHMHFAAIIFCTF